MDILRSLSQIPPVEKPKYTIISNQKIYYSYHQFCFTIRISSLSKFYDVLFMLHS